MIVERGGVSGAIRCECARTRRKLQEGAGIPELYRNASFDNFSLPTDVPVARYELGRTLRAVRTFAEEFPNGKRPGLLLMGEPGTGKTHLAVAALRHLLSRGFEGLFFDYQNLLDRIRLGYNQTAGASDKEAYRFALDSQLLLLDDIGAHRVTEWVEDTVTAIITYRYNHKKPLICTTNLADTGAGISALDKSMPGKAEYRTTLAERIGMRARSRLFEMCTVVRMQLVEDYRLRMR